jgi:hypothetical protein
MEKIRKIIDKYILIIVFVFCIPAIRYLFIDGYFGVSDDLHIGWLHQMDRVVEMQQFPPRYVPDLSFGFGYPLFNFVYPLPFYIAEVFHLIGFSLVDSVKILMGLTLPVSMFFMYRLLRTYLNEELSLAGGILYVYAPYRALEIFVRGSVGEIVAFVFFPLILYAILNGKYLILGLSTTLLILSHNILSFMFFPFVLLLVLLNRKQFLNNVKGILLGLLGSIYFWLPAIYESNLFKYDTVFNFYDHYPTLKQLITPFWGYGASVPGPYDTMSFYSGLTGVFVMLIALVYFFINIKKYQLTEKIFLLWSFFLVALSVFMMNHRSVILWENLPLIAYFQFPWRFLAMLTLAYPLFLVSFKLVKNTKITTVVSLIVIFFAIVTNFNYFKYSEYLGRQDDYYLNRYIVQETASDEYKKTSEEYLRLPKDNTKRPDKIYPRFYVDENIYDVSILEMDSTPMNSNAEVQSPRDFILNYSKYNYPGWQVKIDGSRVNILSGKPFGQISFNVPSGVHKIEVKYRDTNLKKLLNIISLLTIVYLGVKLIRKND